MPKQLEKRRYQERAVEAFREWIKDPTEQFATITIPTGCGKTFTGAMCLEQAPELRILWVAHRKELIDQAADALGQVMPDRSLSIERANEKGDPNSSIVVGSVQTLARDRKHLKDAVFDAIVVDEFHHWSPDNIQYEGLRQRWPNAKILGLTATPFRFGGGQLPRNRNLINMDIGTAVEKGYLVPPVPVSLISNVSLADVHIKAGDFNVTELSKAVNVEDRNKLIAKCAQDLVRKGRQGILFGVDVPHCKAMYELLKDVVRVAQVYGDTPDEERVQIMNAIRKGEVDVLINNLVATEGFDVPHLSFVIVARPTRSLGLFIQMIGRGLRTHPGKTECIIVDVNDKLKIKQSRITFGDMASHGDLYGDKKRAVNVIKAEPELDPLTNQLRHFPVFLNRDKDDRWRTDEESFSVSSWQLTDDQWVVTWTAERLEAKVVARNVYRPWTPFKIDNFNLVDRPIKHPRFGDGHVKKILNAETGKIVATFGWGSDCTLMAEQCQIQTTVYEYSATETEMKKTEKLFYLCMPEGEQQGRMMSFKRQGYNLVLEKDLRLERTAADAQLLIEAERDGVSHIVRCGAKWKNTPATAKQKETVEKMISHSRFSFDVDLNNLTKGEASSLIDQAKWESVIRAKFGSNKKEDLLGYDKSAEDV